MVNKYNVEGFDAFVEKLESLKSSNEPLFILFSGSKDPETGKSWCSDCVTADPILNNAIDTLAPENSNFLYVGVGPRPFWKDLSNPFRKDPRAHINSVPTFVKFGTPQRLEEEQCTNPDIVAMLFED